MSDTSKSIILIASLLLVLVAAIWAVTYRHTVDITIESRTWKYYAAIKWDETHYRMVTSETCSGTGTKRACTTSFHMQPYTETHTRCQATLDGNTLPPVRPALACTRAPGDYDSEYVSYWVTYSEANTKQSQTKQFDAGMWERLAPQARRSVVVDLFGNLKEFAKE